MYHNENKKNHNYQTKQKYSNSRYILNYVTKRNSEKIPLVVGIRENEKNYNNLEKILNCCYLDILTGRFHCKKCDSIVAIDLSRFYIFCPKHGLLLDKIEKSIQN